MMGMYVMTQQGMTTKKFDSLFGALSAIRPHLRISLCPLVSSSYENLARL